MAIVEASQGRIAVRGPLTFATARQVRAEGLEAISNAGAGELQVDCAAVEQSDSAGLAVLLDWLAEAQRRNLSLRFASLPARLLAIAQISEIEETLSARAAKAS